MVSLTSQWTMLERLEWECLVVELRELEPAVEANDLLAWQRATHLLERSKELVKVAHARAARPMPEASAR